ncbi:MAG: AAA family ATPase [Egibacteraceae bacterium]
MLRVLITGMSGTGKSSALLGLARRGHRVVDTDSDTWSHWVTSEEGTPDWIWREDAMTDLLTGHRHGKLFVAGCKTNQKEYYPWFEHVALLSAPAGVLLSPVAHRTTNSYGKSRDERDEILYYLTEVEPLLRSSATVEIDATASLEDVVQRLDELR